MSQPEEKLAVMFADICGSTSLYEQLGDSEARRLIARCIATMIEQAGNFRGTLVKTIGDEIMCTFPDAETAMNAACAMQDAVENSDSEDGPPMHIRIGFHYGDVIREASDVFGDTVNVAARIASITRAGQILTTRAASEALPPGLGDKTSQIMRAELKGKHEQLDIFRVAWETDDAQSTRIGTIASRKPPEEDCELALHYAGHSVRVNAQQKEALLGRDGACTLQLKSNYASRQHARIEFRFGKFVLTDQSTNGSFVRFADGRIVRVAREDLILYGSGTISFGRSYSEGPDCLVEFSTTGA